MMGNVLPVVESWDVVKLIGGIAAVVSGLITAVTFLLREWISTKLRTQQQKEVESLRHEFAEHQALVGAIPSLVSSARTAASRTRMEHFGKSWDFLMQVRKEFPSLAVMAYSLFTRDEVASIPTTTHQTTVSARRRFQPTSYFEKHADLVDSVEHSRPFIGDKLWNILFAYQALHGRLVHLLDDGIRKGKVKYWLEDRPFLEQVLGIAIPEEALQKIIKNDVMAYPNVRNYLEAAFVAEVSNETTGVSATRDTLAQTLKLATAGARVEAVGGTDR